MKTVVLTISEAAALATRALMASGASQVSAASTAAAVVAADVDGQSGHGLSRLPSYALQLRVGKVNGKAEPFAEMRGPASIRIDAGAGFAYPAIDIAVERLAELIPQMGVAAAGIFASHHFGQAGRHVERLAERGFVALAFANSPSAMAFHAGRKPMTGTNPVAFAAPVKGRAPLVIDMSLSVAARGKIVAASKAGKPIPGDWAIDAEGRPTTDASAALGGTLLPVGGVKGAALALMIEVLCGALVGGHFGWEASSLLNAEGGPPLLGHLLVGFNPFSFVGDGFGDRMRILVDAVEAEYPARLPGSRRLEMRSRAGVEGIAISATLHEEIIALIRDAEPA